jgi:ligand-binding SRPBCC domain-containing protein
MPSFELQSELAIGAAEFWSNASLESVNWELAPLVKMTAPREWQVRRISEWEVGRELFRSWILLFGVLPVDRHAFRLRAIGPAFEFREASSSWINRRWNHDREVRASDAGCTVIDRVMFETRVALLAPLAGAIYLMIFRHRHSRLNQKWGVRS